MVRSAEQWWRMLETDEMRKRVVEMLEGDRMLKA